MPRASISERSPAGGDLLLVGLDVDEATAAKYVAPGQYVRVTPEVGDAGYFVLASDPGDPRWQLLVRNAGDAADVLVRKPLGSTVNVSDPIGAGFPMDAARDRTVVLAVAGTALAVARPILRERLPRGRAGDTFIFLGVRSPRDVPLAGEVERWIAAGVRVVLCLSRPESEEDERVLPAASRFAGYVQDALARARDEGTLPPSPLVLAAGPEAMLAALRTFDGAEVITNA